MVLVATAASFSPLVKTELAFVDADGDGYPTPADCDDSNPFIHPNAIETCNSADDNCNGQVDEGCAIYYQDFDRDGWGVAPIGYSSRSGDCDDSNPYVNPGMPENCYSPFDDNCNGLVNEGCQTFYRDNDGDGWGNAFQTVSEMIQPPGYVPIDSDLLIDMSN